MYGAIKYDAELMSQHQCYALEILVSLCCLYIDCRRQHLELYMIAIRDIKI